MHAQRPHLLLLLLLLRLLSSHSCVHPSRVKRCLAGTLLARHQLLQVLQRLQLHLGFLQVLIPTGNALRVG